MTQLSRVVLQENPFSTSYRSFSVEGRSLQTIVDSLQLPEPIVPCLRVWVDDREIGREEWGEYVPIAGQHVYVRVIPQGGEGGGGKDILRTVAMIAIAVVAVATGQYWAAQWGFTTATGTLTFGGQLVAAGVATGVSLVGNLALNALIPPPGLRNNAQDADQRFRLTGTQNTFAPFGNIPRVFGKTRLFPVLAGRPYSEIQGNDEYLRIALCVGWGPLAITDLKIGETPLTAFDGVEYEIREGWSNDTPLTLYTQTVTEDKFSILLSPGTGSTTTSTINHPAQGQEGTESYVPAWTETVTTTTPNLPAWSTRTSATNSSEISVDLYFPSGLSTAGRTDRNPRTVEFDAQYSADNVNWTNITWANNSDEGFGTAGRISVTSSSYTAVRVSGRFKPPSAGQYHVRIRRRTGSGDASVVDTGYWVTMRSIKADYPVLQSGLCVIALRIKATAQLNGVPSTINCIAESYLPVYNGVSWSYALSSNPAWIVCDLLRRRGGQSFIADSRIDLPAFQAWATACAATAPNAAEPRWAFNGVIEGGSVYEAIRLVASNARATYLVRDGKHSIVRDIEQTVPSQHITPRNSWGYSGGKKFVNLPHALRVLFVNAAVGYEQDERIVYMDGYSAANATKFETLELEGCTSATQAFREARYHMAVATLRPEEHTVSMDIEALRCTIGDLVMFAHDAIAIGIQQTRIASVAGNAITLDDEVYLETGVSYAIRVREAGGDSVVIAIQGGANVYTRVVTATSATGAIAAGDLVMFGTSTSTAAPMLVKRIEPGENLSARVTLVDAQPGIYTADTGVIPAWNSYITNPVQSNPGGSPIGSPTVPTIGEARSDSTTAVANNDGTFVYRLAVSITPPASGINRVAYYELQYREFQTDFWETIRVEKDAPFWIGGTVVVGFSYELRVRAINDAATPSDWSPSRFVTARGFTTYTSVPTGFAASSILGGVHLVWVNPTDPTFDVMEVWEGSTNVVANATKLDTVRAQVFDRLGLSFSDGLKYYWIRPVDKARVVGSFLGPITASGGFSVTSLESGIATGTQVVAMVTTLPNPVGYVGPNLVFNTTDGKLYQYTGSAWVTSSALTIGLSNDPHTVACNPDGSLKTGELAQATTSIVLTLGGQIQTTGVTYAVTEQNGGTASVNASGLVSLLTITANTATFTLSATYNAQTLTKVWTVTKVLDGAAAPALFLTATSQTITFDGNGNASPASQTISFTANLANLSGTATFAATAYNSSGSNLGTLTLGGSGNTRTLTNTLFTQFAATHYVVATATLSGQSDTITVARLQAGTNAIVGYLTNEAITLPADSAGTVSSFSGATGTFRVFDGLTERTTSGLVTYSVQSQTGCTVSINSSGVYSVSAMSADAASASLQAVYAGVTIIKVLSLSKARAGTNGMNGATGTRGSRTLYLTSASYTSGFGLSNYRAAATSGIATATAGSSPTTPIQGDEVNFSNGTDYVFSLVNNGSYGTNGDASWVTPGMVLDGNLLVTGSVTAAKIDSRGLTIRDNAGNIIFGVNNNLDWTRIANQPAEIYNSNITINANGTLAGAGGGQVTPSGLGAVAVTLANAPLNILNGYNYDFESGATTGWLNVGSVVDDATASFGKAGQVASNASFTYPSPINVDTKRVYAVRARVKVSVAGTITAGVLCFNSAGSEITGTGGLARVESMATSVSVATGDWRTFEAVVAGEQALSATDKNTFWTGTVKAAPYFVVSGGGTLQVDFVELSDITESWAQAPKVISHGTSMGYGAGYAIKNVNTAAYDSGIRSRNAYVGGAYLAFSPLRTDRRFAIGLNTDPATDAGLSSIDFALMCYEIGILYASESGGSLVNLGSYSANDLLAISYDGLNVRYYRNGSVIRTVAATITAPLFLDSAFFSFEAAAYNIEFVALGVSGLGGLSTQNTVSTGQVTGLGSFATLSQLTSANISTYIAGAAIGTALIAEAAITSAKIANQIQSDNYVFDSAGWAINRNGLAEFSGVRVRGTSIVERLVVTGAVSGSVYVANNSTYTVTHNEGRNIVVSIWSTAGSATLTDNGLNSFTVRLDNSSGGDVFYKYF